MKKGSKILKIIAELLHEKNKHSLN